MGHSVFAAVSDLNQNELVMAEKANFIADFDELVTSGYSFLWEKRPKVGFRAKNSVCGYIELCDLKNLGHPMTH